MLFNWNDLEQTPLKVAITAAYRRDETECLIPLLEQARLTPKQLAHISQVAAQLVMGTRKSKKEHDYLSAFLKRYDLSNQEGIALMCLAEALLRIPDTKTRNLLISDKVSTADWKKHIHSNNSLFVNAATWSLMLTGKIYASALDSEKSLGKTLKNFLTRTSGAVIRPCIQQGIKVLGKQFVMGVTIQEALERAKKLEIQGYRYSYDMLGEAARTREDAQKYFQAYQEAIQAIGNESNRGDHIDGPGISVKLSALHPRYELAQRERVLQEIAPLLLSLAQAAKIKNIGMTIDAEESDRLELSLEIIETVFADPGLKDWEGFGLAVQAYQKRAPFVIDYLADLSRRYNRRIMVRLVKGAYWDSEIKQSQILGLEGYPVFTRKNATDVSYLACAKKILAHPECFYAQFGTHNAYTVAAIMEMAGNRKDFEFQCLHGMGQSLYDQIVGKENFNLPCRIYAPVGSHKDLLGYLVRRLLENGANSSFINMLADEQMPVEKVIADPVEKMAGLTQKPHPKIPLPRHLFGDQRKNSKGLDLSNIETLKQLKQEMEIFDQTTWEAAPVIAGKSKKDKKAQTVVSPADKTRIIGSVHEAGADHVDAALSSGILAIDEWSNTPVNIRANYLEKAADIFENSLPEWVTLLCREGGKTIPDSIGEVREAVDFCRYYAAQARQLFEPVTLTGPTGELNQSSLHGRGIITCISPWNFPLAIFIGQIAAALAAGNVVMAKPAEQTPLIAAQAIRLLHEAGIPKSVLHFLPGAGEIIGSQLVADERVSGVMFTGSTETAKQIQQVLSYRKGPIVPLIAETGGQNAMIVDSSALPEQAVADIMTSAFNSAGQRCSALRVLFVQEEIAPRLLEMLQGAMDQLHVGDPAFLETDIGPVIDTDALRRLEKHVSEMHSKATLLHQAPLMNLPGGHFFAPRVFELKELGVLKQEVFGPILHVIRFSSNDLDQVLDAIIKTNYGLTLGVHSRINKTVDYIRTRMPVGNVYVNRNMIGAVVGVQPFGGERLSGTGPKAGGPHYLARLCVERSISINTTAAGGNTTLVSLTE